MQHIYNAFVFCIYLMDVKLHYFSNKINPTLVFGRLPCVKRKYEKKGQNFMDEYNKVFTNKIDGFSIITALGIVVGFTGLFLLSTFIIVSKVLNLYEYVPGFYFVLFGVIAMSIGYYISFKENKYLNYFEQFEKWSKKEKRRNVVLSFLVIIATIAYFFLSLMCC